MNGYGEKLLTTTHSEGRTWLKFLLIILIQCWFSPQFETLPPGGKVLIQHTHTHVIASCHFQGLCVRDSPEREEKQKTTWKKKLRHMNDLK